MGKKGAEKSNKNTSESLLQRKQSVIIPPNDGKCDRCRRYDYVDQGAKLADSQIRKAGLDTARRTIYYLTWILVLIGFYTLWKRDEICVQLNSNTANSKKVGEL